MRVAGFVRKASSPSPRAILRPHAHSSSAPPRLATPARWSRSATRSIPRLSSRLGVVGLKGDEAKARDYYSRAVTAGAPGARERIASLAVK